MAQHDYVIDNGTGAAVRADINSVLQAIASNNSNSGALTTNFAFQWHVDTSDGLLKLRNAANNGYVTVGTAASTNLGLMPQAGGTFTGKITHNYTSSLTIPSGTTAQRDGSPAVGMFRHNSTLNQFEGYNNGAWGAIGGGATGPTATSNCFWENDQTVDEDYMITNNKNAGSFGPITIASGKAVTVDTGEVWTVV